MITVSPRRPHCRERGFTYSPISSFLFTSSSMKTSTNGSTTPFTTCDRMEIFTSGILGIRITPAPATIRMV